MPQDFVDSADMDEYMAEDWEREQAEEEAWQALIDSKLLLGPDETLLADLQKDMALGSDANADLEEIKSESDLWAEGREIYEQIIARRPEHKIAPTLKRVKRVLDLLGNPERTYRVIHVTGTNGKTTTTRAIEAIAREYGLRTGRFTSPHLHSATERIAIDGEPIKIADFVATYRELEPFIKMVDQEEKANGGAELSFFEIFTLLAFLAFANAPVDVAVVEVGLGGRWDATNVVDSEVAVITSIDVDHQKWLGNTKEEIAVEKAGIIKPKSVVVSASQPSTVYEILKAQALKQQSVLWTSVTSGLSLYNRYSGYESWEGELENERFDFSAGLEPGQIAVREVEQAVGGQLLTLQTANAVYTDVYVPLFGWHQAENMLLAVAAMEAFFARGALDPLVLEHALMELSSPGRLEVVRTSPTVLVDGAHNPAGTRALARSLETNFNFQNIVAIYSAFADKDMTASIEIIEPIVSHLLLVEMDSERAASLEILEENAYEIFGVDRVHTCVDLASALEQAAAMAESDIDDLPGADAVIVTGSLHLVAQARELIRRSESRVF